MQYDSDLFEPPTVQRMLVHTSRRCVGASPPIPGGRLSPLAALDHIERRQLLEDWNDTHADYPQECVHRLFERQVERTPDAPRADLRPSGG